MKNNFGLIFRALFHPGTYGRCDGCGFRHVVSEAASPDVFFTEFTNSDSYCHPEGIKSLRGRLTFTEDEQPIIAHMEISLNTSVR